MTVNDLVLAICKHDQRQVSKDTLKTKRAYVSSRDFLNTLYSSLVTSIQVRAEPNAIYIVYKSGTFTNEDLKEPIKLGYWVCVFYFSADFYKILHFNDECIAKNYYRVAGEQEDFVGEKFILLVTENKISEIS